MNRIFALSLLVGLLGLSVIMTAQQPPAGADAPKVIEVEKLKDKNNVRLAYAEAK